jgi:type I restriction-modification system DNA methylase subunit
VGEEDRTDQEAELWNVSSDEIRNHANYIGSVADLLRADYQQSEYGKVIQPVVVLRRLDCVLEPTKAAVLKRFERLAGKIENIERSCKLSPESSAYMAQALTSAGCSTLRRRSRTTFVPTQTSAAGSNRE